MLIYRFFVRRLTFCLEVTGSCDECLSVANEKGWERKLPLIRSLSDIFLIECHCSWFSQEQGTQGVCEAGVEQLGAWRLALATPFVTRYLPHPCLWLGWCFLGHTVLASSIPCCPRTPQQMQFSWCSSPCLHSTVCSRVLCPHSAWPGMNPCLDLQHPLAGRLPSDFQLKTVC